MPNCRDCVHYFFNREFEDSWCHHPEHEKELLKFDGCNNYEEAPLPEETSLREEVRLLTHQRDVAVAKAIELRRAILEALFSGELSDGVYKMLEKALGDTQDHPMDNIVD